MGRRERQARHAEMMRKGDILRRLHWQCWREDPPAVDVSLEELVEVLPVLIESGSVGLVWPRLAHREDELGAVGAALHAGYEAQVAHNARVAAEIARVVGRLREHSVEPVLIKGYAMARLYPSPLVRSAGDIDLVVRDAEYEAAKAALANERVSFHGDRVAQWQAERERAETPHAVDVDLHRFSTWYGGGANDFFERTETVTIGDVTVRVPGREDHLRALCLHFLWHGGGRPLRLCDIAMIVESSESELVWERCLAGGDVERERVTVAVRLAEQALGACLEGVPSEVRDYELSPWIMSAMLKRWQERSQTLPHRRDFLRGPKAAYRVFASRWPDPISAVAQSRRSYGPKPNLRAPATVFINHRRSTIKFELDARIRSITSVARRLRVLQHSQRRHRQRSQM